MAAVVGGLVEAVVSVAVLRIVLEVSVVEPVEVNAVERVSAVLALWEQAAAGREAPTSVEVLAGRKHSVREVPAPRVWAAIGSRPRAKANLVVFLASHPTAG